MASYKRYAKLMQAAINSRDYGMLEFLRQEMVFHSREKCRNA